MPLHGCKNLALGIELYTERRFIALGRAESAMGDAATDCTLALQCAIVLYFLPESAQAPAQEWTNVPCPKWCGPSDDDLLIERAIRSRSAIAAFGNKASFADLWNANGPVLARAYPDSGGREYDASSADAALAQHLAFWTGKDCERIRRMMERSALVRDKWRREDYLPRTILGAVAHRTEVYVDEVQRRREQVEENLRIGDDSDLLPTAGTFTLEEMLSRFAYVIDGMQVVDKLAPQRIVSLEAWKRSLKASRTAFEVKGQFNLDGSQKTKIYSTSDLWETNPNRSQIDTVTFRPSAQLLTHDPDGRQAINSWRPLERITAGGDASLFIEHVAYLFGDDAARFLDWLAHIEQRPGELPHHGWLHISPEHGTGRNWLASVLARLWKGHVAANFDLSGMLRTGFNGALALHRVDALRRRLIVASTTEDEDSECEVGRRVLFFIDHGVWLPPLVLPPYPEFPPGCVGMTCGGKGRRSGQPCQSKDIYANGRCKWHGGLSTGPKTPEGKARSLRNLIRGSKL
jgi:primase-polymerase (primpol)-like protein